MGLLLKEDMNILAIILIAGIVPESFQTACPLKCVCYTYTTICENLSEIPSYIPGMEVRIINSPNLKYIKTDAFNQYQELQALRIQNTGLIEIEDWAFRGCRNIFSLVINGSPGPTILSTYTLRGLHGMKMLVISTTNLKYINSNALSDMTRLERLDLHGNDIQTISDELLAGMQELKLFDISNNPLLDIPRGLLKFSTLGGIYMANCKLTTLYPEYVEMSYDSGSLEQFFALGNEWVCDTKMCDMLTWMSQNPGFKEIAELGSCKYPRKTEGVSIDWSNLRHICEGFDYAPLYKLCGSIAAIILLVILIRVFCSFDKSCLNCCCSEDNPPSNVDGVDNPDADIDNDSQCQAYTTDPPPYDIAISYGKGKNELSSSVEEAPPPDYDDIL